MFNIAYEYGHVTKLYCAQPTANPEKVLADFKRRYLNADGTGKAYPNGKGYYPIRNPRIVRV